MELQDLIDLLVGKEVFITSIFYNEKLREKQGVCSAVHSILGQESHFDIELEDGSHYGIIPEKVTTDSVEGKPGTHTIGYRKIQVARNKAKVQLNEKPLKKIILTERMEDFHARLDGKKGIWGSGKSPYEAIGNLVKRWPEEFGLEIQCDYEQDSKLDEASSAKPLSREDEESYEIADSRHFTDDEEYEIARPVGLDTRCLEGLSSNRKYPE